MSDIGLPAGFTFFLFGMGLAALVLLLMAAFFIAAALGEKKRGFRDRRAFFLFLGMSFPLAVALVMMSVAEFAPFEIRKGADDLPAWVLWVLPMLSLAIGLLWGVLRRPLNDPRSSDGS